MTAPAKRGGTACLLLGLAFVPVWYAGQLDRVEESSAAEVAGFAKGPPARTAFMVQRAREEGLRRDHYQVEWTPLEEIPALLGCAVVWAEDGNFFEHRGVDWPAFRAATRRYLRGVRGPGGSTISQQLARNLFLSDERTVRRKGVELVITRLLERELGKLEILELYLNVIEWGDGIWGIGPASRHYFGKRPSELDPYEIAFLVSLVPAPRSELAGRNLGRADYSQRRRLRELFEVGYVDHGGYVRAFAEYGAVSRALRHGVPLREALARRDRALSAATPRLSWQRARREACAAAKLD